MTDSDLGLLIRRLPGLSHACDVDLLLFFHRHPRAILTSERLVEALGYDRERVAQSLERLIESGLLIRSPNRSHAARMYVLSSSAADHGPLGQFLRIASTREGRRRALAMLASNSAPEASSRLRPVSRVRKVG